MTADILQTLASLGLLFLVPALYAIAIVIGRITARIEAEYKRQTDEWHLGA